MRILLGSKPPLPLSLTKNNINLPESPIDMESITSAVGAIQLGKEHAEKIKTEENGEGGTVQWGEFQGIWAGGGGEIWGTRGQRELQHDDSWEAFRDDDHEETTTIGQGMSVAQNGQWWCDESTELCTRPSAYLMSKSSLERVFEDCFPSLTVPEVKDEVKPLVQLLSQITDLEGNQTHTRPAEQLLGDLCYRHSQTDLSWKWERSSLQNSYLSSLHIDPNEPHPHKTKTPTVSKGAKEKLQAHKLCAIVGKEPELKLMKVASVSVHVSGFSPSYHLQSLFQLWNQPSGRPRLRTTHGCNQSLLV